MSIWLIHEEYGTYTVGYYNPYNNWMRVFSGLSKLEAINLCSKLNGGK